MTNKDANLVDVSGLLDVDLNQHTASELLATKDLPVDFRLQLKPFRDLGAELGQQSAESQSVALVRNSIILAAEQAAAIGVCAIRFSRDKNQYNRRRRDYPSHVTYANVMKAVASFAQSELLLEERAIPSAPTIANRARRRQSRLKLMPKMFALKMTLDAVAERLAPRERVVKRDRKKRSMPLSGSEIIVRATEALLAQLDVALRGASIGINHPAVRRTGATRYVIEFDERLFGIDLRYDQLVRIFSGSLTKGGRFYRAWWLTLPKAIRATITINGEATAEIDVVACHLQLAYFCVGLTCPFLSSDEDPYLLPDYGKEKRREVKSTVMILLNAAHHEQAVRAVAHQVLEGRSIPERIGAAEALIEAIRHHFKGIERLWHTRLGLWLQHIDSEVMAASIQEMLNLGIVPLPVHDSVIIPARHKDCAAAILHRNLIVVGQRLAAKVPCRRQPQDAGLHTQRLTLGQEQGKVSNEIEAESVVLASSSSLEALADCPWLWDIQKLIADGRPMTTSVVMIAARAIGREVGEGNLRKFTINWFEQLCAAHGLPSDNPVIEAGIVKTLALSHLKISGTKAAKHAGITPDDADRLALKVIRPLPPTPRSIQSSERQKAKRWSEEGVIPDVVPLNRTMPWKYVCMKRTPFMHEEKSKVTKQVYGLKQAMREGNISLVEQTRSLLHSEIQFREAHCVKIPSGALEADALFDALRHEFKLYDERSAPTKRDSKAD